MKEKRLAKAEIRKAADAARADLERVMDKFMEAALYATGPRLRDDCWVLWQDNAGNWWPHTAKTVRDKPLRALIPADKVIEWIDQYRLSGLPGGYTQSPGQFMQAKIDAYTTEGE